MSKSIDMKKFVANGTGPAAQLANAFREAHENVVFRSIEDLNAAMQKFTQGLNSTGRGDFLGLSPNDMNEILYGEFSLENSIFSFVNQSDVAAEKIPILREAFDYLSHLAAVGEVKLTATGSMPRAYVVRFFEDHNDDFFLGFKPNRESDLLELRRIRFLAELLKWTKISKGRLSLTAKGRNALERSQANPIEVYRDLLIKMVTKLEWGFGDRFGENPIVQQAWIFGLYLLKRLATDWVTCGTLGAAFEKAFPPANFPRVAENEFSRGSFQFCFEVRFLLRFCQPFGLVRVKKGELLLNEKPMVRTTEFFKESFQWKK